MQTVRNATHAFLRKFLGSYYVIEVRGKESEKSHTPSRKFSAELFVYCADHPLLPNIKVETQELYFVFLLTGATLLIKVCCPRYY